MKFCSVWYSFGKNRELKSKRFSKIKKNRKWQLLMCLNLGLSKIGRLIREFKRDNSSSLTLINIYIMGLFGSIKLYKIICFISIKFWTFEENCRQRKRYAWVVLARRTYRIFRSCTNCNETYFTRPGLIETKGCSILTVRARMGWLVAGCIFNAR